MTCLARWLASSIHAAGDAELLLVMRVSAPHEMQQQLSHESPARQVCTCSHTEKLAAQKQLCAVLDASSAKLFLCCQFSCMQARGQICVRQIRRRLPCHGHAMGEARKNDAMEGLLCVPLTGNVWIHGNKGDAVIVLYDVAAVNA